MRRGRGSGAQRHNACGGHGGGGDRDAEFGVCPRRADAKRDNNTKLDDVVPSVSLSLSLSLSPEQGGGGALSLWWVHPFV